MDKGNSLELLPLDVGIWRVADQSIDLRQCPDFSSGSESACLGGVGMEGLCREWTTGPYCRLCNTSDSSRYYSNSECLPCEAEARRNVAVSAAPHP